MLYYTEWIYDVVIPFLKFNEFKNLLLLCKKIRNQIMTIIEKNKGNICLELKKRLMDRKCIIRDEYVEEYYNINTFEIIIPYNIYLYFFYDHLTYIIDRVDDNPFHMLIYFDEINDIIKKNNIYTDILIKGIYLGHDSKTRSYYDVNTGSIIKYNFQNFVITFVKKYLGLKLIFIEDTNYVIKNQKDIYIYLNGLILKIDIRFESSNLIMEK